MLALLLNAGLLCAVPAQAASADAPAAAVETAAVGSDGEDGSETAEQEPSAAAETQTETISGKAVSDCTVSLNQTSFYFNGKARHPAVTVTDVAGAVAEIIRDVRQNGDEALFRLTARFGRVKLDAGRTPRLGLKLRPGSRPIAEARALVGAWSAAAPKTEESQEKRNSQ